MMSSLKSIAPLVALIVIAWGVMTFTHEMGHVVAGWISGATLTDLDLAPWRLPFSLHAPDPYPLVTLWGGPLIGIFAPMVTAALVRRPWCWFIADFCLLANGIYLALAWIEGDRFLDTPRLLESGTPPILIALYCLLTIGFGYVRFRKDCVEVFQRTKDASHQS